MLQPCLWLLLVIVVLFALWLCVWVCLGAATADVLAWVLIGPAAAAWVRWVGDDRQSIWRR